MKRWIVRWTVPAPRTSDELHWDFVVKSKSAREAIARVRYDQALPSTIKIVAVAHH